MTHPAHALVSVIADRLAHPHTTLGVAHRQDGWRQSLAHGIPGIALLHIELAAADLGPWQRAQDWLTAAAHGPITSGPDSHPYHGAPALAHALACAADHLPGAYQRALAALDQQIAADARRRVAAAHHRIEFGAPPALAEFDGLRGLTGYGSYLLRRAPEGNAVRAVLDYLVRLAAPITHDGETVPGWWTSSGPSGRHDERFPGGHANNGLAHGITGVLAMLSLAARTGVTVTGQHDAIRAILAWLDRWETPTEYGPIWPYWVTLAELRTGHLTPSAPSRPSWCYGTAGIARSQQLAALTQGDTTRQLDAERALIAALTNPAQLAATTDISLCHGFAGLAHIAARAADDALPDTADRLRAVIPALLTAVHRSGADPERTATELLNADDGGPGLLDGAAGVALAILAPSTATPPSSAWDACLLIS